MISSMRKLLYVVLTTSCFSSFAAAEPVPSEGDQEGLPAPSEFVFAPKIVGGVDAEDGPFRWAASLQTLQGFHFCGGTLIDSGWIVTAAHCVIAPAENLQVVVGRNNLNNNDGSVFGVAQIVVHPDYNPTTFDNDIALLALDGVADAGLPILPLANSAVMTQSGNPGNFARALGWGALSEGGPGSDQLQRVDLPILANAACNNAYDGLITENMICAGFEAGLRDSCQGDSGGPLIVSHENEFVLAGVVSWGFGCARPGLPGVYTRVEQFNDFIGQHVPLDVDNDLGNGVDDNALENGVAKNGLSGQVAQELNFTLDVPAEAANLNIDISDGAGDADLYVNIGAPATVNDFVCRPYINGNEENCNFDTPQADTYHVMLRGYNAFEGVSLVAAFEGGIDEVTEETPEEPKGLSESDLSGEQGDWVDFTVEVDEGASALDVSISGGAGDADLYLRLGVEPTRSAFDCRPYVNGNDETCEIESPEPGTWFIRLRGYQDFSGVALEVVVE